MTDNQPQRSVATTLAPWAGLLLAMVSMGGAIYTRLAEQINTVASNQREIKGDVRALEGQLKQRIDFVDRLMHTYESQMAQLRANTADELRFRRDRAIVVTNELSELHSRISRIEEKVGIAKNGQQKKTGHVPIMVTF